MCQRTLLAHACSNTQRKPLRSRAITPILKRLSKSMRLEAWGLLSCRLANIAGRTFWKFHRISMSVVAPMPYFRCLCVHAYVCMCMHIYVFECMYGCESLCECVGGGGEGRRAFTHTSVCESVCRCVCACVCIVFGGVCKGARVYGYVCVDVEICVC